MPISEQQVQDRVNHVGASDVPLIVMNRGVYDLWLTKTKKLKPVFAGNEATECGLMIEPGLMRWAETQIGPFVHRTANDGTVSYDVEYRHPSLCMVAHLDGQRVDDSAPVEAKTKGMVGRGMSGDDPAEVWGEPGTAEVPDKVIFQVHAQMMCVPVPVAGAHVVALIAGRGRLPYYVPCVATIIEGIGNAVDHFWVKHVLADIPPEGDMPSWEYARLLPRNAGEVREIGEVDLIRQFRDETAIIKLGSEAEKRRNELREQLVGISDGAEFLWADGVDGAVRIYKVDVKGEEKPRPARVDTRVQYVKQIK